MTQDPYQVLGVPRDASEDEIKRAYRRLAKRYHPDLHPGDAQAEEKMRQINDAYDRIKNRDKAAGAAGYEGYAGYGRPAGGFGGFGGFDGYAGAQDERQANAFRAARSYINAGYYDEALHVLSEITERNAPWYYYSAVAHAGSGNLVTALAHAQRAVQLQPGNPQYQALLQRLQQGGRVYSQRGAGYGFPGMRMDPMCALCAGNLLCMLCGGGGMMYPMFCCL